MDLGCVDLGCISVLDKQSTEQSLDSHKKECDTSENVTSASKTGKSKSPKGTGQSTLNALNKFTSQIKKPPHRKNSPVNWFPRKKVDSYLKRKIKLLQEVDGMKLTLDETLGDSNPHYSRVLREKMAAREAAQTAMEARKAALVEASWCKILRAARIQCKEAETLLLKAEKTAAEAFEAATALGVIMYDTPNCPRKPSKIETSTVDGGRSTTHTVTASFETAFDVDKEVAAAVKTAFVRLSSCPSFDKDEFKELLCKISQNPDMGENNNNQEVSEFSSEYESESGSELERMSQNESFSAKDVSCKLPTMDSRLKKTKRRQSLEKLNPEKLVDVMLDRLRCLKEDELSSLATIVATCGLNAALAEEESSNIPRRMSNIPRRISSAGAGSMRYSNLEQMRRKQVESELPSLDKFLVKHMTKLEREVQEAKNTRRNGSIEGNGNVENRDKIDNGTVNLDNNTSHESIPDLGSILVKHYSKLKKEIEEANNNSQKSFEIHCKKAISKRKEDVQELPSLDKFLIKHVSRLEKEVQEAKNIRKNDLVVEESNLMNVNKKVNSSASASESEKNTSSSSGEAAVAEKENVDMNKEEEEEDSLDKILVKPVHRLEREKMQALSLRNSHRNHKHQRGDNAAAIEGLDKVLVKHVSRLEKEKMEFSLKEEEEMKKFKSSSRNVDMQEMNEQGGLDQILVKHKSRLEREKMAASQQLGDQIRLSVSRREARERELQEAWEGVSLGSVDMQEINEQGSLDKILVKHKSRLEKEKMAAPQLPGDQIRLSVSRREARERELQEAWGGLSLGNSIKPHLSKLEKDKAAWIKAEEEERSRATKDQNSF